MAARRRPCNRPQSTSVTVDRIIDKFEDLAKVRFLRKQIGALDSLHHNTSIRESFMRKSQKTASLPSKEFMVLSDLGPSESPTAYFLKDRFSDLICPVWGVIR